MKRLHIHVDVEDINQAITFYSALFGAAPVKTKDDYAKWLLDDPSINFAISTGAGELGVNHLGIQVDEDEELATLTQRLSDAGQPVWDEGETECCYARSKKAWVKDSAGIPWEAYRTMADVERYYGDAEAGSGEPPIIPQASQQGCCA